MNSEQKGKRMMIVGIIALVLAIALLSINLMGGKETQTNESATPSRAQTANTPRIFSEKASEELLNLFRVLPQSEQQGQTEQVKEVTAEQVSQLIKSGANVNTSDGLGRTPLLWSVFRKLDFQIVKLLIDNGANVNAIAALPRFELTPLMGAVVRSDPCFETVKYLVENGADVNVSMNGFNNLGAPISGITPLIYAVHRSQPCLEVVKYLIENGADVNAAMVVTGGFGPIVEGTPLILAINAKTPIDIVKVLIDAGADVNATAFQTTPLIAAIEHSNLDVMRLLIENGADVNAAAGGMSPLHHVYARRRGSDPQKNALAEEKYKILLDAGADDSSIRQMEDTFRRHFGGQR